MNNQVLSESTVLTGVIVYSVPWAMRGDTALGIAVTMISGSTTPTIAIKGSYDLTTWASTGITTNCTLGASPNIFMGTSYGIYYPYARVEVTGGSLASVLSVAVGTFSP